MSTSLHYERTYNKKFISKVTAINQDDTLSEQKPLSGNVLVFKFLSRPARTVLRSKADIGSKRSEIKCSTEARRVFF